jgi:hypothetical protein
MKDGVSETRRHEGLQLGPRCRGRVRLRELAGQISSPSHRQHTLELVRYANCSTRATVKESARCWRVIVKLDLVGHARRQGAEEVSTSFANYNRSTDWHLSPAGWMAGRSSPSAEVPSISARAMSSSSPSVMAELPRFATSCMPGMWSMRPRSSARDLVTFAVADCPLGADHPDSCGRSFGSVRLAVRCTIEFWVRGGTAGGFVPASVPPDRRSDVVPPTPWTRARWPSS